MEESVRGDTTSTTEIASKQRRRHKRHQKRTRLKERNRIGFVGHAAASETESPSSSSDGEMKEADLEDDGPGAGSEKANMSSLASSISFAEESFTVNIDRISDELDGLVRYVRKAVDVMAGGSSETTKTFGILSFMLEEWDM